MTTLPLKYFECFDETFCAEGVSAKNVLLGSMGVLGACTDCVDFESDTNYSQMKECVRSYINVASDMDNAYFGCVDRNEE
eukprot:CAMPEP_0195508618 /NCGR_PEP_ID=MMETSP0794_2-20130614/1784_1 /TAXON_ID=515487 /ORGANISM="Stephanopyxis turris, Strain CCMP 815" /LENGTH=79 /DNA_ID=CAMNT_0040635623 /DNA_START=423 /DNA_END=662 /DNA_ORIENTATION=-